VEVPPKYPSLFPFLSSCDRPIWVWPVVHSSAFFSFTSSAAYLYRRSEGSCSPSYRDFWYFPSFRALSTTCPFLRGTMAFGRKVWCGEAYFHPCRRASPRFNWSIFFSAFYFTRSFPTFLFGSISFFSLSFFPLLPQALATLRVDLSVESLAQRNGQLRSSVHRTKIPESSFRSLIFLPFCSIRSARLLLYPSFNLLCRGPWALVW